MALDGWATSVVSSILVLRRLHRVEGGHGFVASILTRCIDRSIPRLFPALGNGAVGDMCGSA